VHATLASIFILRFLAFHMYKRLRPDLPSNIVLETFGTFQDSRTGSQSELTYRPQTAVLKQPRFDELLYEAYVGESIFWEDFPAGR
jgi:hypothetical protein